MDLQLIEAYVPIKYFDKINESLQEYSFVSYFTSTESLDRILIRILVKTNNTEDILNYLENRANVIDGFEVILLPVQTYITRPSEEVEKEREKEEEEESRQIQRASRQELLGTIEKSSKINISYILLVIISAVVVTVGFIKDSEAVIIGAMVIAPLLGPVISIAFAAILGDYKLIASATISLIFALLIVIFISILFSWVLPNPLANEQFTARTQVDLSDIVLALASGTAGALSILKRLPGSLVGVMVAVALLPPAVALGMSMGTFMWEEAYGALLLLLVNINSILFSAILVFSLTGIRPVKWEEIQKANTSRQLSFIFVGAIIILLIVAIVIGKHI